MINKNGFSLVELSIVLVILGLLTGGILSGQSLIRAAELRSVSTEYQRHIAAIQTFRDKYFAIPGDFKDATKFWGRAVNAAHCVTNSSAAVVATGVCDGNANGQINLAPAASQSGEYFQFWRQLALAGLVEGTYTGLAGSGAADHSVAGTNIPPSKLGNAAWSAYRLGAISGHADIFTMDYENVLLIGAPTTNSPTGAVLKPEEAWNIDTKMDDGRPGMGKVIARYWNDVCATGAAGADDVANATYKLSDTSPRCALYFIKGF